MPPADKPEQNLTSLNTASAGFTELHAIVDNQSNGLFRHIRGHQADTAGLHVVSLNDGSGAPPVPGDNVSSSAAPAAMDAAAARAMIGHKVLPSNFPAGSDYARIMKTYVDLMSQCNTEATRLVTDTTNQVYKDAGIDPHVYTPLRDKNAKLTAYFHSHGYDQLGNPPTQAQIIAATKQEVNKRLGIPDGLNPGAGEDRAFLVQQQFLKHLGLPDDATAQQQVEALKNPPKPVQPPQ